MKDYKMHEGFKWSGAEASMAAGAEQLGSRRHPSSRHPPHDSMIVIRHLSNSALPCAILHSPPLSGFSPPSF